MSIFPIVFYETEILETANEKLSRGKKIKEDTSFQVK